MALDDYTAATAKTAYYPAGSERPARLWATEKLLHDLAAMGAVQFFEGAGTNPTGLSGYATSKLWLQVSAGLTATQGTVRAYDGSGDATLVASWPALDRKGLFLHAAGLLPPGADRILFWDQSALAPKWLTPGTGIVITGTTIDAGGGTFDVLSISTRAVAIPATIGAGVQSVVTSGYATVGDNGGARYLRSGSAPSHAGYFQSSDGAYWVLDPNQTLTPEMFGAIPDNSGIDNRTAFAQLATYCNAKEGGRVVFQRGVVYTVLSGTVADQTALMAFNDTLGLHIDFNGAVLQTDTNYVSQSSIASMIQLQRCRRTTLRGTALVQSVASNSQFYGIRGLYVVDQCVGLSLVGGFSQTNGLGGLMCTRGASYVTTNRTRDIDVDYCEFDGVFYPLNFQKCGDNVRVGYAVTKNAGRSYFPYNVSDHDIKVVSSRNAVSADDVLIAVITNHAEQNFENATQNIKLRYTLDAQYDTAAHNSIVCISYQQGTSTTTAARIQNIDIHMTAASSAGFSPTTYFYTNRVPFGGGVDTTARGYVLDNLRISGHLELDTSSVFIMNLFAASNGDFSVDQIRNITIEDLVVDNPTASKEIVINAAAIDRNLTLRNIAANCGITISNAVAGVVSVGENVVSDTLNSHGGTWTAADGNAWYRYLPNGMLEQGGWRSATAVANTTVTMLKGYRDIQFLAHATSSSTGTNDVINIAPGSTTTATINRPGGSAAVLVQWRTIGRW